MKHLLTLYVYLEGKVIIAEVDKRQEKIQSIIITSNDFDAYCYGYMHL